MDGNYNKTGNMGELKLCQVYNQGLFVVIINYMVALVMDENYVKWSVDIVKWGYRGRIQIIFASKLLETINIFLSGLQAQHEFQTQVQLAFFVHSEKIL